MYRIIVTIFLERALRAIPVSLCQVTGGARSYLPVWRGARRAEVLCPHLLHIQGLGQAGRVPAVHKQLRIVKLDEFGRVRAFVSDLGVGGFGAARAAVV